MSNSKPQCREGVTLDLNPCLLSHLPLLRGEGEERQLPVKCGRSSPSVPELGALQSCQLRGPHNESRTLNNQWAQGSSQLSSKSPRTIQIVSKRVNGLCPTEESECLWGSIRPSVRPSICSFSRHPSHVH